MFTCWIEAPPEVFDTRTLYDKLKEQHEIKKAEYESQHALSKYIWHFFEIQV